MFGGGYWPPEGIELCDICGNPVHPGQCSGGVLAPDHRTITEPNPAWQQEAETAPVLSVVPDEPPETAPVRGSKRQRRSA